MRFANSDGRMQLIIGDGLLDVGHASGGALPADPALALGAWDEVLAWAAIVDPVAVAGSLQPIVESRFDAPSPSPGQVLAVGLNYAPHAEESGFAVPAYPFVFTKLQGSLAGPVGAVTAFSDTLDWEVEVVVVIGKNADHVSEADAWRHVAGLTTGQDFSDRATQNRLGPNSQPTLGKSYPGYGPTGPYLVTPDEYTDPDDIALTCTVNGVTVQDGRTSELVFSVPALIAYLSAVTVLRPGDLIFTGTPAGVGVGRTPPLFLKPGDVIDTTVEHAGTMRHTVTAGV